MCDDDILPVGWSSAATGVPVSLSSHVDERQWTFYSVRSEAVAHVNTCPPADLLALHGDALGRTLAEVAAGALGPPDLANACAHLSSALVRGEPASVRVTISGVAGDGALSSPAALLLMRRPPEVLLDAPAALRIALTSREVVRTTRSTIITHEPACMMYCTGLANDVPLAPFMPIGRNEDGVFAATIAFLLPLTLFAYLPVGVVHDSPRASAYDANPHALLARGGRFADVLLATITACHNIPLSMADVDARRRTLAQCLKAISRLDRASLLHWLFEAIVAKRGMALSVACRLAQGRPLHWREALGQYEQALCGAIPQSAFILPTEFRRGSASDAIKRLQSALAAYADLLVAWPDLWRRASQHVSAVDFRMLAR
jgi:hypothetical protein